MAGVIFHFLLPLFERIKLGPTPSPGHSSARITPPPLEFQAPNGRFASGNGLERPGRGKKGGLDARSGRFGGRGDTLTSQAPRRLLGWQAVGNRHIGLGEIAASRRIRSRIARYSQHGTATYAIWKVTSALAVHPFSSLEKRKCSLLNSEAVSRFTEPSLPQAARSAPQRSPRTPCPSNTSPAECRSIQSCCCSATGQSCPSSAVPRSPSTFSPYAHSPSPHSPTTHKISVLHETSSTVLSFLHIKTHHLT